MEPRRMERARLLILCAVTVCSTAVSAADWHALERYQQTISRTEFETLLAHVYCPSGALTNYLTFSTNSVSIFSTPEKMNTLFTLHFSSDTSSSIQHPASFKRIALDPGHIGGEWAR